MDGHDLLHEFPEYKGKINELKQNDFHFRELFEKYDELEHEINRINRGIVITTDEHAHELKAKLLFIKDEIFSALKQN